jgi:alkanesulfonate monooxygenase SsuD/methylene tetrahydromethanopterin reductase-like flavin-dependent oxidoreductase (luciferase family)
VKFGLAPVQSHPSFEAMREQARTAEDLGFDALWAHEHHSQAMMYPDPLMTLAALAPVTQRIALGTNMLLLPIHHPVRVAQAAAMVDVLSNGRLRLGVANGYSRTDLRTFGVTHEHRGARLTAGIELIQSLWSGEPVTSSGPDFDLEAFRLFPLPVQRPRPPILVGGSLDAAIARAARLGDDYLISTTERIADVRARVARYHTARDELGLARRAPTLNRIVCTVESSHEKRQAEEFYTRALLALYDAWGHANITSLDPADRETSKIVADHFIIGEAADCLEQIERYREIGIGHIACLMNFGGPEITAVNRSLRLFGEQVLPQASG